MGMGVRCTSAIRRPASTAAMITAPGCTSTSRTATFPPASHLGRGQRKEPAPVTPRTRRPGSRVDLVVGRQRSDLQPWAAGQAPVFDRSRSAARTAAPHRRNAWKSGLPGRARLELRMCLRTNEKRVEVARKFGELDPATVRRSTRNSRSAWPATRVVVLLVRCRCRSEPRCCRRLRRRSSRPDARCSASRMLAPFRPLPIDVLLVGHVAITGSGSCRRIPGMALGRSAAPGDVDHEHCRRGTDRQRICRTRALRTAPILPSIPRTPNPPGSVRRPIGQCVCRTLRVVSRRTAPSGCPPWPDADHAGSKASVTGQVGVGQSTYLPTSAILRSALDGAPVGTSSTRPVDVADGKPSRARHRHRDPRMQYLGDVIDRAASAWRRRLGVQLALARSCA